MNRNTRANILLVVSLLIAVLALFWGGLKEKETADTIRLVISLSLAMAGFGLVAFQIARASNELKNDFIDTSILMVIATLSGFLYLLYPEAVFFRTNFGEAAIFLFFWAFVMFLIILIDKRFNVLR